MTAECCVCYQPVRLSARNYSTGYMCENGHSTCVECYYNIPSTTPSVLNIPTRHSNGKARQYRILTQTCPVCRCVMAGNSIDAIDNAVRMVALPDRPEGALWAEVITRFKQGMPASCVDSMCEAEMRSSRLPDIFVSDLQRAGRRLLQSDASGYYAEFVYRVLAADGPVAVHVQTGRTKATLASTFDASKWAAMHGNPRACYHVGRAMIGRAMETGHLPLRALALGAWHLHFAARKGHLEAVVVMVLAAARTGHPKEMLRWLAGIPLVEWAQQGAGPLIVLQAQLAFQNGLWDRCVRCMAVCPPHARNWHAIGRCLEELACTVGGMPTLIYAQVFDRVRAMIREEKGGRGGVDLQHRVLLVTGQMHVGALAAFVHGSAECAKCAEAAAYLVAQYKCNWVLKKARREQLPVHFFRLAAAHGSVPAMRTLAQLFVSCPAVAPRVDEARAWLERAAAAGCILAQDKLQDLPAAGALRCAARHADGQLHYCAPEAFSRRQRAQKWYSRRCKACIARANPRVASLKAITAGQLSAARLKIVMYQFGQ